MLIFTFLSDLLSQCLTTIFFIRRYLKKNAVETIELIGKRTYWYHTYVNLNTDVKFEYVVQYYFYSIVFVQPYLSYQMIW